MQRHRTEHKMGTQGFNTDERDETRNTTIFDNYMRERVYISSDNKQDGTYADSQYNNNGSIVKRGVSGIGIEHIDMFYSIPNVNGNNNTIRWQEDGGNILTETLDVGFYNIVELYTAMTDAMTDNAQSMGVYSYDDDNFPTAELKSTVDFKFQECSFINNGDSLTGLYYTDDFESELKSIPYLLATSYIDIVVSDILNGQIAQSSYGKQQLFNTTQHLARVMVNFSAEHVQHIIKTYDIVNYVPFRHRDIKDLRIQLLDEYNNILWSDTVEHGGTHYELKYLKYFITLNTVF